MERVSDIAVLIPVLRTDLIVAYGASILTPMTFTGLDLNLDLAMTKTVPGSS